MPAQPLEAPFYLGATQNADLLLQTDPLFCRPHTTLAQVEPLGSLSQSHLCVLGNPDSPSSPQGSHVVSFHSCCLGLGLGRSYGQGMAVSVVALGLQGEHW